MIHNRVAIGSSGFHRISKRSLFYFLDEAWAMGVRILDTAPIYGNAEILIGEYIQSSGNAFNVLTKLGLKDYRELNRGSLVNKLEISLGSLRSNTLHTLFLHSIPHAYIDDELLESLQELKNGGRVKRIGYSGDNEDLDFAIKSNYFDDFMVSINLLDMSNFAFVEKISTEKMIYVKRPLANAVWKNWYFNKCKFQLYKFLGARRTQDTHNYFFRYQVRRKSLPSSNSTPQNFLKFVASIPRDKVIVVGTTDVDHLKSTLSSLHDPDFVDTSYFIENLESWHKDNKYQWRAMR